jgi:hypothetical protein
MTTATSLILIAVGAILTFAVSYEVAGIDIQTVGIILIVVGGIGLAFSLAHACRLRAVGLRSRRSRSNSPASGLTCIQHPSTTCSLNASAGRFCDGY